MANHTTIRAVEVSDGQYEVTWADPIFGELYLQQSASSAEEAKKLATPKLAREVFFETIKFISDSWQSSRRGDPAITSLEKKAQKDRNRIGAAVTDAALSFAEGFDVLAVQTLQEAGLRNAESIVRRCRIYVTDHPNKIWLPRRGTVANSSNRSRARTQQPANRMHPVYELAYDAAIEAGAAEKDAHEYAREQFGMLNAEFAGDFEE